MNLKVKFLTSTVANKQSVKKDQVMELGEAEAISLVLMGRAILFKEIPESPAVITPAENLEPVTPIEDEKPTVNPRNKKGDLKK